MIFSNFFSSTVTVVSLPNTSERETIAAGDKPDSVALQPEEVFAARFEADGLTLAWERNYLAERYNIYRGAIASVRRHGACRNGVDDDLTDTHFSDLELPGPGEGFSYLIAIDHDGSQGILGYASDGTLRQPDRVCPGE